MSRAADDVVAPLELLLPSTHALLSHLPFQRVPRTLQPLPHLHAQRRAAVAAGQVPVPSTGIAHVVLGRRHVEFGPLSLIILLLLTSKISTSSSSTRLVDTDRPLIPSKIGG